MKITKSQLKRIIKEELKEYAMEPSMAEEPPMEGGAGPPSGAEDIGAAAYELGRFFGGRLAERAEIVAKALEEVGATRAAEKLRQGAIAGTPAELG